MTVSLFIMLLTLFSAITGICTEGLKNLFAGQKTKVSPNVIAFVVAIIVGVFGTAIYYILCAIPFNVNNVICMFLMGVASSMGAMVGYDKIIQTIKQLNA